MAEPMTREQLANLKAGDTVWLRCRVDSIGYLPPEACIQKLGAVPDVAGYPGRKVEGWMVVARLCEIWGLDL